MSDRFKIKIYDMEAEKFNEDSLWIQKEIAIDLDGDLVEVDLDAYDNGTCWADNQERYIKVPCTGRKDSKGILIYEGDLIKDKFNLLKVVKYSEELCAYCLYYLNGNEPFHFYPNIEITIVGNIYAPSK